MRRAMAGLSCVVLAACNGQLALEEADGDQVGSTSSALEQVNVACDGANDFAEINRGLVQDQRIVLSPGRCIVSRTLAVTANNITIEGAGPDVTIIEFAPIPSSSNRLFKIDNLGIENDTDGNARPILNVTLKNLGIQASTTCDTECQARAKTAVYVHDARNFTLKNVSIGPWDATDDANRTVGVEVRGRDMGLFSKLSVEADVPLKIGLNDDAARPACAGGQYHMRDCTKDLDHHHFEDVTLQSNDPTNPVVKVEPGAVLRNVTFDGYQSWKNGGLYWADVDGGGMPVTPRRHSTHLRIANLRVENLCEDACNSFAIQIEKSTATPAEDPYAPAQLEELEVEFSDTAVRGIGVPSTQGPGWKGIRARGVTRTVLRQVVYEGQQTTPNDILPAPIEDP